MKTIAAVACALLFAAAASAAGGLGALSDEFDGTTLAGWTTFRGDDFGEGAAHAVSVEDGALTIVPKLSWWVDDKEALYVWKPVTGDFVATMHVRVTGEKAEEPQSNWTLSGILVRNPRSEHGNENWLAFRTGVVNESRVYERKTTVRSRSILVLGASHGGWVDLRVARVGSRFFFLRRNASGKWVYHWLYSRPDLPKTLQVGIDAFTGFEAEQADMVSRVDWFRFSSTAIPGTLRNAKPAKLLRYLSRP